MSFRALTWAIDAEIFPSSRKFVLIALANHASDTGKAFPGLATICQITGQKKETAIEALKSLEADGIIKDTGERTGNTKKVKVYQLPEEAWKRHSKMVPKTELLNGREMVGKWSGNGPVFGHPSITCNQQPNNLIPPTVPQGGHEDKISDRTKTFTTQFWERFPGSKPIGVKRISKHLREAECLLASGVSEDQVFRAVDILRSDDFRRGWVSSLESVATKWPEISGHLNGKLRPIAKMSYKEERSDEEEAWLNYDNQLAMFKAQGGSAPECPSFPRP